MQFKLHFIEINILKKAECGHIVIFEAPAQT